MEVEYLMKKGMVNGFVILMGLVHNHNALQHLMTARQVKVGLCRDKMRQAQNWPQAGSNETVRADRSQNWARTHNIAQQPKSHSPKIGGAKTDWENMRWATGVEKGKGPVI